MTTLQHAVEFVLFNIDEAMGFLGDLPTVFYVMFVTIFAFLGVKIIFEVF